MSMRNSKTLSGTASQIVTSLQGHLQGVFKKELEYQITELMKPLIEKTAETIANGIVMQLLERTTYDPLGGDSRINFLLRLDGIEKVLDLHELTASNAAFEAGKDPA